MKPILLEILVPISLLLVLALSLSGCKVGMPYRALDSETVDDPEETVVVGLTHIVTGKDRKRNKVFWSHVLEVSDSMKEQPGLLGYSIRRQLFGREGWTMSVWTDHQSLDAFVRTAVHREAMREGGPALASARFARVELSRDRVPLSWKEAERILEEEGLTSEQMRAARRPASTAP